MPLSPASTVRPRPAASTSAVSGRPGARTKALARSAARWLAGAALLVSIAYAVALGQHIEATLGDASSNTLYASSLRQIQVLTFLRVAVAAAGFWLIILRPRAGAILAVVLGVFTVLLFTLGVTLPSDPGPPAVPPWLQAIGLLAAVGMIVGAALTLRRGGD